MNVLEAYFVRCTIFIIILEKYNQNNYCVRVVFKKYERDLADMALLKMSAILL